MTTATCYIYTVHTSSSLFSTLYKMQTLRELVSLIKTLHMLVDYARGIECKNI